MLGMLEMLFGVVAKVYHELTSSLIFCVPFCRGGHGGKENEYPKSVEL